MQNFFRMRDRKCVFEKDKFLTFLLYGKRYHYQFSQFSKNA